MFTTRFALHHGTTASAIAAAGLVVLTFLGCGGSTEPAAEEDLAHGVTAVTLWTDSTELFFEYPPMVAGQRSEPWAIHVTRLSDFSPVTTGELTLALRGPTGEVFTTRAEAPVRAGIYTPAPTLPTAGQYDVVIDIDGPMLRDRLSAGAIVVFQSEADIPAASEAADTGISFLKEQQWPIEFAVALVREREVAGTVEIPGEIGPAAGRVAVVAAPVSGLALAEANLSAPAPGERVRAGQTLVVLSPTSQDNSFAQSKANVERLEREVERLTRLFDVEAIPERRLIEARHDLEVAQSTFEAMGGSDEQGYSYTVSAPMSGIVQRRPFTPGQRVEAGEPLFEIISPEEVWVRLRVPSRYSSRLDAATARASFTVEGSSRQYRAGQLVFVGGSIDTEDRTVPVTFSVANTDNSLKIGQYVSARVGLGSTRTGLAVPIAAIQNEDGVPVVYVQTGGETFERRTVALGATDGVLALVEEGVAAGEHVVVEGAYQVYLASLSTSDIGGHGHPH